MSTSLIVILCFIGIALVDFLLYAFSSGKNKLSIHFARVFLGLVFIFSGFVKAVDPLGSMYKFQDYFQAFSMEWLMPAALFLGFALFCLEFVIGFSFLFNVKMKFFSWLMLLFMTFFFILTAVLAINNPVSDCGCFGDALILTNWETFFKNIALMIFALIVFWGRKTIKNRYPDITQFGVMFIGLAIILWISVYSYRHLPLMDFMPWKIGNRISEKVVDTPEKAEIKLVYKNKVTGEIKKWTSKTLPWQDTAYFKQFEFVDQEKTIIQEYKPAPIHDFMVDDSNKVNHNADIIGNPGYQFLLISHNVSEAERSVFPVLNVFYEQCKKDTIGFAALCGSDYITINKFRAESKAAYEFYTVDETALKSVVRSNPGLVLLKNGVVLDKWAWRDIPSYKDFREDLPRYGKMLAKSDTIKGVK